MSLNSPMVQQNNLNKCPHGFPVGTCPICSGHGGISKDKNKPRVKGEMSYNECMAVWIRMQNAKKDKLQQKIQTRLETIEKNSLKRKIARLIAQKNSLIRFYDKINTIKEKIDNLSKNNSFISKIVSNVLKLPLNIVQTVLQIANFSYIATLKTLSFLISVQEKLSSLLGEIKSFINSKIFKKTKELFKTILSLFCETESQDDETKEKINFRKIKNLVKNMFNKKVTK